MDKLSKWLCRLLSTVLYDIINFKHYQTIPMKNKTIYAVKQIKILYSNQNLQKHSEQWNDQYMTRGSGHTTMGHNDQQTILVWYTSCRPCRWQFEPIHWVRETLLNSDMFPSTESLGNNGLKRWSFSIISASSGWLLLVRICMNSWKSKEHRSVFWPKLCRLL